MHIANDIERINKIINLFKHESFGTSREESSVQFEKKVKLNLLLNRMKSISSTRNKTMKRYSSDLINDASVLIIRAFWEPKWIRTNDKKRTVVEFKEVRHFFLEYLNRNPEAAINFLKTNEGEILCKGTFEDISHHVPYRELREEIRTHPNKIAITAILRRQNPGAMLFESTHDNDLVQLRIARDSHQEYQQEGLYSFYEEIISNYIDDNKYVPDVVTTGYRAAYETQDDTNPNYFNWLFIGIEEDRYIRQALSRACSFATYYPEPNCLYFVPEEYMHLPYSFLEDTDKYYNPPEESRVIIKQIKSLKVLFDASHPVIMRLPADMRNDKRTKQPIAIGEFNETEQKFTATKIDHLNISAKLKQSPLAFLDLAHNLYNQFGFKGIKWHAQGYLEVHHANRYFNSFVSSIFNAYDPFVLIKEQHSLTEINDIRRLYNEYEIRFKLNENIGINEYNTAGNAYIIERCKHINKLSTHIDQIIELRELMDDVFGINTFDTIHKCAMAVGKERLKHIISYFVDGLLSSSVKKSPTKFIAEYKKYESEKIKFEDQLKEVKRTLFQLEYDEIAEAKEEDVKPFVVPSSIDKLSSSFKKLTASDTACDNDTLCDRWTEPTLSSPFSKMKSPSSSTAYEQFVPEGKYASDTKIIKDARTPKDMAISAADTLSLLDELSEKTSFLHSQTTPTSRVSHFDSSLLTYSTYVLPTVLPTEMSNLFSYQEFSPKISDSLKSSSHNDYSSREMHAPRASAARAFIIDEDFVRNILKGLYQAGHTQKSIGEKLHVSQSIISTFLGGKNSPTLVKNFKEFDFGNSADAYSLTNVARKLFR